MAIHWNAVPENHDCQLLQTWKRKCEPYRMQFFSQWVSSTFATNELFQNLEFFCATALDSARIVKNVSRMIGELKFVIDAVFASLTPCSESGTNEERCSTDNHKHLLTVQVWPGGDSEVRSDSRTNVWITYLFLRSPVILPVNLGALRRFTDPL